jgi:hypothetical protein
MPWHGTDTEDHRPITRSPSTASHKFRSHQRLAHSSHCRRYAFLSTPAVPRSPPRPRPTSATPLDTSRSHTTASFSSAASCVLPLPAMAEPQPVTMAHCVTTMRWRATVVPDSVSHDAAHAEQGATTTAQRPYALPHRDDALHLDPYHGARLHSSPF